MQLLAWQLPITVLSLLQLQFGGETPLSGSSGSGKASQWKMGRAELHLLCTALLLWLLDELRSEVRRGAVSIKYQENSLLQKGVCPRACNSAVRMWAFH